MKRQTVTAGAVALLAMALAACTTAADVSKPIEAGKGNDAKVQIIDTADGFNVDVKYSRYQMIPESSALLVACRSMATARAYEEAKTRGKEIEPINEQTIRVSTGRNGLLGLTSCRAFAEAHWKR
jgi:predicted small secreted protein